jgi:hypothetical protein
MLCERNILFLFELYIFYQNIIKVHTIHLKAKIVTEEKQQRRGIDIARE